MSVNLRSEDADGPLRHVKSWKQVAGTCEELMTTPSTAMSLNDPQDGDQDWQAESKHAADDSKEEFVPQVSLRFL